MVRPLGVCGDDEFDVTGEGSVDGIYERVRGTDYRPKIA
jgi:hypothetical protein